MIHDFQTDLRNGMTLEDALIKYDMSFGEAVRKCRGNRVRDGKYHNIYMLHGKFRVEKMINGEVIYTGVYEDLEEALRIRDLLEANDWNKECLNND